LPDELGRFNSVLFKTVTAPEYSPTLPAQPGAMRRGKLQTVIFRKSRDQDARMPTEVAF
jgi:hypothetical protein